MVDRGANGCIIGKDMSVIERLDLTIDLSGLDDHTVRSIPIVNAGGYGISNKGPVIAIVNQGAHMPDGKTILSSGQMEHFGCTVNEKARIITGKDPYLETVEGYRLPITIRKGLAYLGLRPFTRAEWEDPKIPKVHITSPRPWDPGVLDHQVPANWYNDNAHTRPKDPPFSSCVTDHRDDDDESTPSDDDENQAIDRGKVHKVTRVAMRAIFHDLLARDESIECHVNTRSQRRKQGQRENTPKRRDTDTAPTHRSGQGHDGNKEPTDTCGPLATDDDSIEGQPGYLNPAKDAQLQHDDGIEAIPRLVKPTKRTLEKYGEYLIGANLDTIRKTLEATTQHGTRGAIEGVNLRNQILSPNPILNIPRRSEDVATDTLYGSVPSIEDGSTAVQFFIGRRSLYRSVRSLGTSDKNYPRALLEEIRRFGSMLGVISDNAKAQVSNTVKDIYRTFAINDWHSEPYKGNQNFAERGWKDTKTKVKNLLNYTGADAETWVLALSYVCFVQNHLAIKSLGWRTPTEWMLGYTPDISVLLQFRFWEPVYYAKYDAKFPQDPTELLGRFVGVSENVGHAMTFKVLSEDRKIVHRAVVRTATKGGMFRNLRADKESPTLAPPERRLPGNGNTPEGTSEGPTGTGSDFTNRIREDIIKSKWDRHVEEGGSLPTLPIEDLIGRTFIDDPNEQGEQSRGTIEEAFPTGMKSSDGTDEVYKFRCRVGEETYEEIMTYNKMLEWCERDVDTGDLHRIDAIEGHRKAKLPTTQGNWEVKIRWSDGSTTWNCLSLTFEDDPVSVSLYAKVNKLLGTPGWKRCRKYAERLGKLARTVYKAQIKCNHVRPVYKYGYQVPRHHGHAMSIDERLGTTKWRDAEKLELAQLWEYKTFKDMGKGTPIPEGYTKIPCHLVYDVKHDGRHKARFVAGGHRTSLPTESVFSSVVTLQGIRLVTFLAEHNNLELWGTDIGNAYLESYTKEKVCFIAGPEFDELEGHLFIIEKALYGLRSSGKCWAERIFSVLVDMGFFSCKADPDIWMRDMGDHYEYIAVYVDDLLIASRKPGAITSALEDTYKFKLKGTGKLAFHLGCDYARDDDGTLFYGPKSYIERIALQFIDMFGHKPKTNMSSPLEKGDHPELDTTPLLDEDGTWKYQSLIGALQWTISLNRFDIGTAVMTMSGFRVAPREGHLDRVKRIVGYLVKMKHGYLRVRTEEPDLSMLQPPTHDWSHTVYGDVKEDHPKDAPPPKGNRVITTSWFDANLQHDMVTGRSVMGIIHAINKTVFEWYTKKQATVETATYGSEFVAAKTTTQQVQGLRTTLRYLGVEVHGPTRVFGDNGSVITSGSIPHSPLKKRHHALAYHYTREAVASGMIELHHIPSEKNPADILSKHWGYQQVWPNLQAILFWRGDTAMLLLDKDDRPTPTEGER